MWFTLVLFDVSIRGLSPPTPTLLFDLHQSGPDHSAFVYFQRHFSFLHVSLTPHSRTLCVTCARCICVCVCRFQCLLFSEQMFVRMRRSKSRGVLPLDFLHYAFLLFLHLSRNITSAVIICRYDLKAKPALSTLLLFSRSVVMCSNPLLNQMSGGQV